jgi:hypothetical protein
MPTIVAAPHTATSARYGTAIRVIDVAIIVRDPRSLVRQPGRSLRRFAPVIKSA